MKKICKILKKYNYIVENENGTTDRKLNVICLIIYLIYFVISLIGCFMRNQISIYIIGINFLLLVHKGMVTYLQLNSFIRKDYLNEVPSMERIIITIMLIVIVITSIIGCFSLLSRKVGWGIWIADIILLLCALYDEILSTAKRMFSVKNI